MLVRTVVLDDQARLGRWLAFCIGGWAQLAAGHELVLDQARQLGVVAVTNQELVDRGSFVTRLEARHIDRVFVRADSQCTRRVSKEAHDAQWHATHRTTQAGWVEHPDVSTADTRRGQLRVTSARHIGQRWVHALLTAVSGSDEGFGRRARKHDVAWLVTNQQCARDMGHAIQAHDADAV